MECSVITTYRCNAKCDMCNIYRNQSVISEEFRPEILEKLPNNITKINVTGGEPTLREDIIEIIDILNRKAKHIDLSTNGYFPDRLEKIGERFPNIAVRISAEGLPALNDSLRGLKNGFDRSLKSIIRLRDSGVSNVGLGMVISDKNNEELLDLYKLCAMMNLEFATSTLHNSFYFNKFDNTVEDVDSTVEAVKAYIQILLNSPRKSVKLRVKDWGRAYINYGILEHIKGAPRPLPCGAATELFFVDPYANILACNGSDSPWILGNLHEQEFEDIWHGEKAQKIRERVKNCNKNCWMVGSARPAMRTHILQAFCWIVKNKYFKR